MSIKRGRIFCKQMISVQEKMLGITHMQRKLLICDQYPRIGSVLMTSDVNQGDPTKS